MSQNKKTFSKGITKVILIGVVLFFAAQLLTPLAIFSTKQANAQWAVFETGSVPEIQSNILDKIWAAIKTAADVTFKNVLKTYINQLAYNAAINIATSGEGQTPLWPTIPLAEIGIQAADVAAGDFLDEVANDWLGGDSSCYGYNITCKNDQSCPAPVLDCSQAYASKRITVGQMENCSHNYASTQECIALGCRLQQYQDDSAPKQLNELGLFDDPALYPETVAGAPSCANKFSLCDQSPQLKLSINMAARSTYDQSFLQTGKCPVTSIIDNFENQTGNLSDNIWGDLTSKQRTDLYLAEIAKTFNPDASQFGATLQIINETSIVGRTAQEGAELTKTIEGPVNSVTSLVTDVIRTPGPLITDALSNVTKGAIDVQSTYTGSLVADAIGTFTNTLASKLLTRYFEGLVSDDVSQRSSTGIGSILSYVQKGIAAAKLLFADLKLVDYSVGGNIDILTNLSSCPDQDNPTSDTCVIDARFATAIQQQLTVREAIDQGLLDGARTFGFETDLSEPEYYNGYPYRSLVILRKYRIIPVGWELAAKYMQKYAPGRYSLSILIAEFDNPDSPFYKLVDPNWVLKAPQLFCAKEGAGEKIENEQAIRTVDTNKDNNIDVKDAAQTLITRNTSYCADEQLCLAENDDGSCKKYGYCVEEEPAWKFNSPACEPQNNSCLAFGDGSSYLTNTVDYGSCSADNAGCNWYCQEWDQVGGEWQCINTAPISGGKKISLTDAAGTCSESDDGCTELIPINGGSNLVPNSSFEDYYEASLYLGTDGLSESSIGPGSLPEDFYWWSPDLPVFALRAYADTDAFNGFTSARLHMDDTNPNTATEYYIHHDIDTGHLTDGRTFTVSLYAKRANDADPGVCNGGGDSISFNLKRYPGVPAVEVQGQFAAVNVTDQWTRYAVTTTWGVNNGEWENEDRKKNLNLIIRKAAPSGLCDILIDNVQVEEGGLTDYKEYEDSPKTYLTKPPAYLNCTGNTAVDVPECNNFALYCSPEDVGCQQFTSFNTGNIINGRITDPSACDPNDPYSCDQCPAELNGCQAFRELATTKIPLRPAVDPVSFVPDSGSACPVSAVGCEEYTNLEEVSLGGEGKEYYSEIRQCVLNTDADIATYYTWQGSEEFGYQLKDYRLKVSNNGSGDPCTNMAPEDPLMAASGLAWPNCIDNFTFNRNATTTETYLPATCLAAEVGVNPDCTEFFDVDGNPHYVLKSKVIYADANCKIYRNSIDSAATCNDVTGLCNNNGSACGVAAAADDSICNEILYHLIPGQGQSCAPEYNGCRAYKGNAGDNSRAIYTEDFEGGDIGNWTGYLAGSAFLSNESVNFGGHSMLADSGVLKALNTITNPIWPSQGNSYNISFWAKGAVADETIRAFIGWAANFKYFEGTALARVGEWNRYELGPLYMEADSAPFAHYIFESSGLVYIDNIVVSEVVESIYRVKDSYTECSGYENCQRYDDSAGGIHYLKSFSGLCDESKIGCEAFIDTQNTISPFPSQYALNTATFFRGDINNSGTVDGGDLVAYNIWLNNKTYAGPPVLEVADINNDGIVDTSPYVLNGCALTGNIDVDYFVQWSFCGGPAINPTTVTGTIRGDILADDTILLVNDSSKSCLSTSKGCERMGEPVINSEGIVTAFNDVFLLNNPDNYSNSLCEYREDGCTAYTTTEGSQYYFKDPGVKVCDYKRVSGQNSSGWYKTETTSGLPDCPVTQGVCEQSGLLNGFQCRDDADCVNTAAPLGTEVCNLSYDIISQPTDGWVGTCPSDESGCTEYRDPETVLEGTADRCNVLVADGGGNNVDRFECDSYYYISNEIDEQTCNGIVSRDEGCRLFYDTSDPNLIYYSAFTTNGNPPVISCDPTEPLCVQDSNTIIKVRQDRTCSRWLECSSSIVQETKEGKVENLCQEVAICDKMDQNTSHCVSWAEYANANQTFSSPAFAEKVSNYSGLVLAGLDWGRRCEGNPYQVCQDDTTCTPGIDCCDAGDTCGDPQIIEGDLPVAAMGEVGSVGISGNLIAMGDFGDSVHNINEILTFWLTGGIDPPPDPYVLADPAPTFLDISRFDSTWSGRDWAGGNSEVYWAEASEDGIIPSPNANIDENNVLIVKANEGGTSGQANGASYDLGTNIVREQDYVLSFKMKWRGDVGDFDRIRAEFGYKDTAGTEFLWQVFGDDIIPDPPEWKEYILGPITAGYDDAGNPVTYAETVLNIIHIDIDGSNITPVEYYLDDVSLKPVLQTKEDGGLITRDCRLYPRDDSKYCTYTDENNTTYKGWYGYCLERDPQNSSSCINWWPVDLLAGESDQINTLPTIFYSGRSPLYMCLQAEGNYSTEGIPGCYTQNIPGSKYDPGATLGNRRVMRTHLSNNTIPTSECNTIENAGCRITADFCGHGDWGLPGLCGCAENTSLDQTTNLHADDQYYEHQVESVEFVIVRGSFSDWPEGSKFVLDRSNNWDNCWSGGNNSVCARINFDANRRMISMWGRIRDWSPENGGAWVMGLFHLREYCTVLSQVATPTDNIAWFDRTNVNSSYIVPDVGYSYDQHYTPFGGVIQPSPLSSEPANWNVSTGAGPLLVQESGDAPTSYAHAGSPLSFSNVVNRPTTTTNGTPNDEGSARRWCSTVVYRETPPAPPWISMTGAAVSDDFYNECKSKADIAKCWDPDGDPFTANSGVCIGVGQGFCQDDLSLRCDAPTEAVDCIGPDLRDYGPCIMGTGGSIPAEPVVTSAADNASERLQRLFANSYGVWRWNNSGYAPDNVLLTDLQNEYINMPLCTWIPSVSRVIRNDAPNDYCGVPPTIDVSASGSDGTSSQFIRLGSEGGRVQFNLSINADEEQLPIKRIEIDWNSLDGESVDSVIQGSYGNGSLTIDHIYQPVTGNAETLFRPKFRVVDNWGWCSVPLVTTSACPFAECRHSTVTGNAVNCGWLPIDGSAGQITVRVGY